MVILPSIIMIQLYLGNTTSKISIKEFFNPPQELGETVGSLCIYAVEKPFHRQGNEKDPSTSVPPSA